MQDTIGKMVGAKLIEDSEALTKRAGWYHRNKVQIETVAKAFEKIEVQTARLSFEEVDIGIAGDRHTLQAVFGVFRKLGYEPSSRPGDEPSPSFSCRWNHPDLECRFWLYFTSTKCTRVKVGTETREVDLFETVCE